MSPPTLQRPSWVREETLAVITASVAATVVIVAATDAIIEATVGIVVASADNT